MIDDQEFLLEFKQFIYKLIQSKTLLKRKGNNSKYYKSFPRIEQLVKSHSKA